MPAFFGKKLAWIALDFGNRFWDYPGPGTALREPAFLLQGIQPVVNAAEIIEVFPMVSRSNSYYSVIIVVLLTGAAAGQEASKPWWNPFSTTSPSDGSVRSSSFFDGSAKKSSPEKPAADKSTFSFPKMPWTSTATPKKSSSESTFSRMGKSSKKFWNSTVDFLNPFDSEPKPKQQGYQPQNTKTSTGSGPFGWLWREEKTETPATVNDFLRQPRPKF